MSVLAMHRHDNLWAHPAIHLDQFGPAGMARDMDMRLALGDDPGTQVRQLVHDAADRDFIAGNNPRGEDHGVALGELEFMRPGGDAAERRARLALAAGRDDQHFTLWT